MDPSLRHELRLKGRRRADAHLAQGQETADKEPLDIPRDLPWLPPATVVLRRPAALGGLETTVDIPDHGQGWSFACDVADTPWTSFHYRLWRLRRRATWPVGHTGSWRVPGPVRAHTASHMQRGVAGDPHPRWPDVAEVLRVRPPLTPRGVNGGSHPQHLSLPSLLKRNKGTPCRPPGTGLAGAQHAIHTGA